MKKLFIRDPAWVSRYSPWITTALLESANIQQLWTMWTRQTARGQSLTGWITVGLALILWTNFYSVVAPEQNKTAFRVTALGVCINALVWLTVLYFRATGRG